MTILGARTGNGKSAFALQLAWDIASQYIPVLFVSLEMYEEDLVERLFCLVEKIDNYELLKGHIDKYEMQLNSFKNKLRSIPLIVTDMLGKSWQEINEYIEFLETKPTVIFIDHLQEAKSETINNPKEIIEEYLKKMRIMAIRDDISIVVCSQINRANPTEKAGSPPGLHHLKSSGYIEESADIVILLHWPYSHSKKGDKEKFSINVAKNRNGRTGWIDLRYKPENYWFYEEEAEEAQTQENQGWDREEE